MMASYFTPRDWKREPSKKYQERDRNYHRGLGTLEHGTLEPDTVFIKDVSVEYRYKLLKDTIRVVERDSIPYQVTVTEIKEIKRPLTWYDHFSRAVLWLNIGLAIYWLIRLICKFR